MQSQLIYSDNDLTIEPSLAAPPYFWWICAKCVGKYHKQLPIIQPKKFTNIELLADPKPAYQRIKPN